MTQDAHRPYAGSEPGQPPARKGFPVWLIVVLGILGFVVLLIGALGAIGYHSFTRFVRASKQAEARHAVGQMARDAAAAWEREQLAPDGSYVQALCPSASSPVPADLGRIRGVKTSTDPSEWLADASANAGFACLRFRMDEPQFYQYDYKATGAAGTLDRFEAIARGDLDGDGKLSTFRLEGRVLPGAEVGIAPTLLETDPDE